LVMANVNVLFIDDDTSIGTLATALLESWGFRILAALDTAEADRILQSEEVHLIVCDVMLPKEDGFQFCSRLRKEGRSVPLLFLSVLSEPQWIAKGMSLGANGYYVKPFDPRELRQRLLAELGRSMPTQSPRLSSTPTSTPSSWLSRITQKLRNN